MDITDFGTSADQSDSSQSQDTDFNSSNGELELPSDIEAMFGNPADDRTHSDKSVEPKKGFSDINMNSNDPESLLRSLQSQKDKLEHKVKLYETENKELKGAAEFINALYEDQEVREAFIAEVAPDLIQRKSPEDFVKKSLEKEFGKDFVPDPDEENVRGSKAWLYNKRADILYEDYFKQKPNTPENLKSLREKRKAEKERAKAEAIKVKTQLMGEFNWDEDSYQDFVDWANKISPKDLALIKKFVEGKSKSVRTPNLAAIPGGGKVTGGYFKVLDDFFGT